MIWGKAATDYHGALVRLATMRANDTQYLLFGYVELFPRDLPVPKRFNVGDKPWTCPGLSGVTFGVSAISMPVLDALSWYENASQGKVNIPLPTPVDLVVPLFGVEPSIGQFSIGEEVPPFVAPWHGNPRIHRLVPMKSLSSEVEQLKKNSKARKWLSDNLGFDLLDHEEWIASLSLIAPDPLFSRVNHYSLGVQPNGSERWIFQSHRRRYEGYPTQDADELDLVLLQERQSGLAEVLPAHFDSDGVFIKDYLEPTGKMGYAISCPDRGLLRMQPPAQCIQQVSINLGIINQTLNVEVPSGGRRKPEAHYTQHRATDVGQVSVGKSLPLSGAIRIAQLQELHKARKAQESAPQKLFGRLNSGGVDQNELTKLREVAESYVASLVANAKHRIVFVDPDFGLREYQNYAFRAMFDNVKVQVLTGVNCMNRKPSQIKTGCALLKHIDKIKENRQVKTPEVFVMPNVNEAPIFHDRFLVVDDVAWSLGPSFNELGERIGLISKVHEPQIVIDAIEGVIKISTPLKQWVSNGANDIGVNKSDV